MLPCRYATIRAEPAIDASQNISDVTATHDNGITTITFTRPRVSTDNRDLSLDQCVYFLYAWGGSIDYSTCRAGQHTNREPSDFQFCIPDNCGKEICWVSRVCYIHVLQYTLVPRLSLEGERAFEGESGNEANPNPRTTQCFMHTPLSTEPILYNIIILMGLL